MANYQIKVVLSRNSEQRSLLKIERRKKLDFFSFARGESKHATYHATGRTHTNVGKWMEGNEHDHHKEILIDKPSDQVEHLYILTTLLFINNEKHHLKDSFFAPSTSKNKKNSIVKIIDESQVDDGDIVLLISGIAKDEVQISALIDSFKQLNNFSVLITEKNSMEGAPSMFIAAIKASGAHDLLISEINSIIGLDRVTKPQDYSYSQADGNSPAGSMIVIPAPPGVNFGPAPPPRHTKPRYLPIKPSVDDPVYEIQLYSTPFESNIVEVGPISLRAIHPRLHFKQLIDVVATKDLLNSLTIMLPIPWMNFYRFGSQPNILSFDADSYRGYTKAQTLVDGVYYQLEITCVLRSRYFGSLNDFLMKIFYNEWTAFKFTYDVKVTVLQSANYQ